MQINSGIGIFNCGQIMHSVPAEELVQKVVHCINLFGVQALVGKTTFQAQGLHETTCVLPMPFLR
jgi:hypothetical protein